MEVSYLRAEMNDTTSMFEGHVIGIDNEKMVELLTTTDHLEICV